MKLILMSLLFFTGNFAFANEDQPTCPIDVKFDGEITPLFSEVPTWEGNYKIGFEVYGVMELRSIELGKKYRFSIPCHDTYIRIYFDYNTHPVVGEMRVSLDYKGKRALVRFKIEHCDKSDSGDVQSCSGFKEKLINNIALR